MIDAHIIEIIRTTIRTNRENTLTASTRKSIADTAEELRETHGPLPTHSDLDRIFEDMGIELVEDDRVVAPVTLMRSTMMSYIPPLVMLPTYGNPEFRRWYKSHELAHGILHGDRDSNWMEGLEKEQQANYFTKNLVGKPPLKMIRNGLIEREIECRNEPLKTMKEKWYGKNRHAYIAEVLQEIRPH